MTGPAYLEHLTDSDLALLASIGGKQAHEVEWRARLRNEPGYLESVLQQPALFAALFGDGGQDTLLRASPFCAFAVLVQRAVLELRGAQFVEVWVGPRRRVPVFQVEELREFLAGPARRLFLAELLASYTHVASGSVWVQTPRGWRRRRFSELDPVRLAEMAGSVPEWERGAIYRRLGDLSLFLTGVFPDYTAARLLPKIGRERLRRTLRIEDTPAQPPAALSDSLDADVRLLEQIGTRAYRVASKAAVGEFGRTMDEIAHGFGHARQVLNYLTDRYLFPHRHQWFPVPEI